MVGGGIGFGRQKWYIFEMGCRYTMTLQHLHKWKQSLHNIMLRTCYITVLWHLSSVSLTWICTLKGLTVNSSGGSPHTAPLTAPVATAAPGNPEEEENDCQTNV